MDAYTNDYAYVGTRATGSTGGTYLITPDWHGRVTSGMTQIKSPTDLAWILNRILVKGPADVPNVHAIQDKISVLSHSVFEGKTTITQSQPTTSKQMPIAPQPALIPTTGIEIYDEICKAMVGNSPNPPDPQLLAKFESIGIGPIRKWL